MTQTDMFDSFDAARMEETVRRGTLAEKVLNRLLQGPATSIQLNAICYRYSARIHELKKAGHSIEKRKCKESNVWIYELK